MEIEHNCMPLGRRKAGVSGSAAASGSGPHHDVSTGQKRFPEHIA
jgi:hypothetical protein